MNNIEIEVFNPDNQNNFDTLSHQNGQIYWLASDLAKWLGYTDGSTFFNAVNKAIGVCTSLGITVQEHFKQYTHSVDGQTLHDYKLTRFACYLATLNADVKKPNVARAQVYFASLAQVIQQHIENTENVERVLIRQEITDREKSLNGIAKVRAVENYAAFCNAGYMGLYNMSIGQIRKLKGLSNKETPLDFMGKRELAANLFRITETEGRIKDDAAIVGQTRLETIARKVGSEVRGVMKVRPEVLAQQEIRDIKAVKKNIKNTSKKLVELDSPRSTDR